MIGVLTYVVLSLAGIGLPLIVLRMTALSRPVLLTGKEQVSTTLQDYDPDLVIDEVVVSAEHQSALATLKGKTDLVAVGVIGDRFVVRVLQHGGLLRLMSDALDLILILDDFAWPGIKVSFSDQTSFSQWKSKVQVCLGTPEEANA